MITANPFEVLDSRLNVIESLLSQIVNRPTENDEVKKDIGGLEVAIEETGLSRSSKTEANCISQGRSYALG